MADAQSLLDEGLQILASGAGFARSAQLMSKAIATFPQNTEASYWKAKLLFATEQVPAGLECLHAALRRGPHLAQHATLQALVCSASEEYATAAGLLRRAAAAAPNDAAVHFELGICAHQQCQYRAAVQSYSRALALHYPQAYLVLANRADCLHSLGKVTEALQDLDLSLTAAPECAAALQIRASVQLTLGRPELAHRDFSAAIQLAPGPKASSELYCRRALCYGQLDEADLERAQQADPSNPTPWWYRASVLSRQGRILEAISHLATWIDANPNHKDSVNIRSMRAEYYASLSNWTAAVVDYQAVVQRLASGPAKGAYGAYQRRLRVLQAQERKAAAQAVAA